MNTTFANTTLAVRKHLPHNPPVRVSQYTAQALYFITICADRRHYGIIDTNSVGRVIPNAPHIPDGGLRTNRPTNALTASNNAVQLLLALDFYRAKGLIRPRFALIMPDHLHMIASLPESSDMAKTIRSWKRWTAKETCIVWQDGFFDHRLRNDAEVAEKMDYIAKNPVRKRLCETANDWPFRMAWR